MYFSLQGMLTESLFIFDARKNLSSENFSKFVKAAFHPDLRLSTNTSSLSTDPMLRLFCKGSCYRTLLQATNLRSSPLKTRAARRSSFPG